MARTVLPGLVRSGTIRHDEEVHFDGWVLANPGPELTSANVTIGAAWGSTATRTVSGRRFHGRISVASSGTGQAPGASITVTFPGGAFPATPRVFLRQVSGDLAARIFSVSATQFVIVTAAAPTAGVTYEYEFVVLPA